MVQKLSTAQQGHTYTTALSLTEKSLQNKNQRSAFLYPYYAA